MSFLLEESEKRCLVSHFKLRLYSGINDLVSNKVSQLFKAFSVYGLNLPIKTKKCALLNFFLLEKQKLF